MMEENGKKIIDNTEHFKKDDEKVEPQTEIKPAPPEGSIPQTGDEKPKKYVIQIELGPTVPNGFQVSGHINDPGRCYYMLETAKDELKAYWAKIEKANIQAAKAMPKVPFFNQVRGAFGGKR